MRTKTLLPVASIFLAMACVSLAQEKSLPGTTSEPPKLETGRFGNPTSTARAYQHFELGIVEEIKKDELILDKTSYGDGQPFKLVAKTKFVHDGEGADVSKLKIGDHVFVDVKTNKKTGDLYVNVVAWGVVGKRMKGQGINK